VNYWTRPTTDENNGAQTSVVGSRSMDGGTGGWKSSISGI